MSVSMYILMETLKLATSLVTFATASYLMMLAIVFVSSFMKTFIKVFPGEYRKALEKQRQKRKEVNSK